MGVPADLLAVPSIVTIAGCIGRRATLRAKRHDWFWVERPRLWAAIIAPKGSLKTPALALTTAPLRAAEARHRERWNMDLGAWEARQDRGRNGQIKMKPDDPKPLEPKLVMTNATIEAMADAMVESRGLTMVRDELSGWVNNMSRYSKGDDRQFYLECHSGGAYAVDRIVRGRQIVPDIYLNVVGGIQPKVAKKAFQISEDGADDGYFERFGLICYPDLPDWQGVRDVSRSATTRSWPWEPAPGWGRR
jgi:putative DNA primase/helicase